VKPALTRAALLCAFAVLGAAAAVLLGGETGLGGDTTTVVADARLSSRVGWSIAEVYSRAAPGVVVVRSEGDSLGSGFVVDEQGSVVTNYHVVGESDDITVSFSEDEEDAVEADVVGVDPSTDLALLDVDVPASDLTPLPFGELADVEVGDEVVAIGSPFGLERTATAGIVSGLARQIDAPDGFAIRDAVQTDALLNDGSSGGPLLNVRGEMIGVITQVVTGAGGGIGYAVPVDTVKEVIAGLLEDGEIERAFLGISMDDDDGHGVVVEEVVPDSPAAAADVRVGDVIVRADGKEVGSSNDLAAIVAAKQPGDGLALEVRRTDSTQTLAVTLGTRPS
jgi:S1-C subfamily serine protease